MALRDQPYFPFYVDDYMADEKLAECSAESHGVYQRIMCLMHKSEEYGVILLQQKYQQAEQQTFNFAEKLSKHMPFSSEVIERSLKELISEDVLQLNGDKLLQKRMICDNEISLKRASAGKKGGFATAKKSANTPAKHTASTVNENESVIEDEDINDNKDVKRKLSITERDVKFKEEVFSHADYDNRLLQDFYNHWSEATPDQKKMLYETKKTWHTGKRLAKWKSNDYGNYGNKKQPQYGRQEVSMQDLKDQAERVILE